MHIRTAGIFLVLLLMTGCQSRMERLACEPVEPVIAGGSLDEKSLARLAEAPRRNREREGRAFDYFREAGCPDLHRQPIPFSRQQNVICLLPGESDQTIVIGAHFDKLGGGHGFADNWSGVVIATRLIEALIARQRQYTIAVIAFGEEEDGMRGAATWLIDNERSGVRAMVNLDTLGLGPLVADPRSGDQLLCLARSIAEGAGIELAYRNVREITGDWEPFKRAGVPVISFHSLDRRSLRTLHSRRDRLQNVNEERLDDAWRMALSLVLSLDRQQGKDSAKLSAQAP